MAHVRSTDAVHAKLVGFPPCERCLGCLQPVLRTAQIGKYALFQLLVEPLPTMHNSSVVLGKIPGGDGRFVPDGGHGCRRTLQLYLIHRIRKKYPPVDWLWPAFDRPFFFALRAAATCHSVTTGPGCRWRLQVITFRQRTTCALILATRAGYAELPYVRTNSPRPWTRPHVRAKARTSSFIRPSTFHLRLNNRFSSRNGRQLITSSLSSQPRRA